MRFLRTLVAPLAALAVAVILFGVYAIAAQAQDQPTDQTAIMVSDDTMTVSPDLRGTVDRSSPRTFGHAAISATIGSLAVAILLVGVLGSGSTRRGKSRHNDGDRVDSHCGVT